MSQLRCTVQRLPNARRCSPQLTGRVNDTAMATRARELAILRAFMSERELTRYVIPCEPELPYRCEDNAAPVIPRWMRLIALADRAQALHSNTTGEVRELLLDIVRELSR